MSSRLPFFFIVALALGVLAAPPSQASFPGANGKIAFAKNNDIWTMNPDGSNQVDITNTPVATEDQPSWSADGTRIAYLRDRAVWRMNADGSGQTQVVPAPNDPSACGQGSSVLAQGLGGPAWSPSGSKIAFSNARQCRFDGDTEFQQSDLDTVNPDGTGLVRLDAGAGPRWSPDGGKIGYTAGEDGVNTVGWITPDGSQKFTVYETNVSNEHFIDWSPDGFWIDGGGEGGFGHPGFYSFKIHPDGTGYSEYPSGVAPGRWSPDGTKFLLSGVYTENTDGSNLTKIADGGAADWQPVPYTHHPRPRGASPFLTYLVPAYKQCAAPNRTHGSPLAFPSCSPPAPASSFLTVGTPDANGQGAKSIGSVFMAARPADILVGVSITDVRNASDLSDYAGDLQEIATWRITDNYNGPSLTESATMLDVPFPVTVPCATTGATTVGSTCAVNTTWNAIVAGSVRAGKREVVELGQVQVFDGGPDGDVTTADNTLFMDQGVFVP